MLTGKIAMRRAHLLWVSVLCLVLAGCASGPSPSAGAGWSTAPTRHMSTISVRLRVKLQHYYRDWAGVPYAYGGATKHGIDCSAFVQQALAATRGIRVPRTTLRQSRRGDRIPTSQLRVGDLVFFRIGSGRHVGIYMGNRRFMHASSSIGVTISNLDNIYWRHHFWQARRMP